MNFISFRRELIDRVFESHLSFLLNTKSEILDVGGVKKRRGRFQIPKELFERWKTLNNNPKVDPDIVAQLPRIPCPDRRFELVVMTEVLEYIPEYQTVLSEINRILVPGGHLFITFPFLSPLHGDKQFDCLRLTPTHFEKIISAHFQIIEQKAMGGPLLVFLDSLRSEWFSFSNGPHPSWPKRLWWKKISLFHKLIIFLDFALFPHPKASTTGYFYLLRRP